MALVVEDGSGLSTADSYISRDDADTYIGDYSNDSDWSGASNDDKDRALRRATEWLDGRYADQWLGYRKSTDQALSWPRTGVYDRDGNYVDADSVPAEVERSTALIAVEYIKGTDLDNSNLDGSISMKRSKVGDLEQELEYQGSLPARASYFPTVDGLLKKRGLILSANMTARG